MWNWMHGGNYAWGVGMIGMGLFWILLIASVVWVAFAVWGRESSRKGPGAHAESPLEILQRRYARGEIDSSEYEERRRLLS